MAAKNESAAAAPAAAAATAAPASSGGFDYQAQVAVVGAGPVGLTIANYLAMQKVKVVVFEQLDQLIDYPRAIGIDDEALRTIQSIGLVDQALVHTTPFHNMRFFTASGRKFADIKPMTDEFGFSRRNSFNQPELDMILYRGLIEREGVQFAFSRTLENFTQDDKGVTLTLKAPDGKEEKARVEYLVASDGGSSKTRHILNIPYEGTTAPNQWVVVDIKNDPLATPHLDLCADPVRPYVSAAMPHGIRRFEYMVMPNETEEEISKPETLRKLLSKQLPNPDKIDLIRIRVYNHNQRIASKFRDRRVILAGDAAHIMPVWQGQGYNSGMRDAFNLAWKVAMVAQGKCGDKLLDSYETERKAHAKAMIDLSVLAGKILNPPNQCLTWLRDALTWCFQYIPPVNRYLLEMRFKPMPMYKDGALVRDGDSAKSEVGKIFPQPKVRLEDGTVTLLDNVIGPNFAVINWNTNPFWGISDAEAAKWKAIGTKFIQVVPEQQMAAKQDQYDGVIRVGDCGDRLREWFARTPCGVAVVRPDRFVAAQAVPQTINTMLERLSTIIQLGKQ